MEGYKSPAVAMPQYSGGPAEAHQSVNIDFAANWSAYIAIAINNNCHLKRHWRVAVATALYPGGFSLSLIIHLKRNESTSKR